MPKSEPVLLDEPSRARGFDAAEPILPEIEWALDSVLRESDPDLPVARLVARNVLAALTVMGRAIPAEIRSDAYRDAIHALKERA